MTRQLHLATGTSVVLAAVLLLPGRTAGQSIGASVAGVVRDESGALLPQATVTITNSLNGHAAKLTTGSAGEFRAVALLPGDYAVTAERAGFAARTRHLTLLVGADATVTFTLGIAGVTAHTTVSGGAPLVEVARSQPSSALTRQEIDTLPGLERNFLVLAQLLPGSGSDQHHGRPVRRRRNSAASPTSAAATPRSSTAATWTMRNGAARRSTSARTRCRSSGCSATSSMRSTVTR